jgi:hypothetical protein
MWWLFQSLIIFAVMCVAIYYDWQHVGGHDRGIAPVAIAIFAAWLATWIFVEIDRPLARYAAPTP